MRWLAFLTVMAVLSAGCSDKGTGTSSTQPAAGGRPRIALSMKSRQNPFFARMAEGAELKAKELGVDLELLATDKETDTEKQTSQIETVISKGVDVILMTPVDSKAIVAPLLQAQARGIKIINIDNRIDQQAAEQAGLKIEAFIGPDNVDGARKSTRAMIEKIGKEGGKIAMIEGVRGADNAEQRKEGFNQAVAQAKRDGYNIEVVAMDTGEWMTEPAQKKMEGILNQHPDLKGVFCANDMMALGAIQAIASAGKTGQIVVTAYDNLEAAQEAIKAGKLYATIEQHPNFMGQLGVDYAVRLLKGEQIPAIVEVPTDLVTAAELLPAPATAPAN
ncbi:MAG TPA: substrate-binding domain-containing protein [Phycisphaerae bacterium]|jgi:ribose transport system substrate-binding protein|nr:sugar ABC transporter substrate-binding protein [Phycisphaerae bacterium]HOB73665.1 substrate-binding domain-containing protein [Phycisphaerae bacterium]HOJ54730.1 substrate-binding domain-containing protein [Phycisphaerae bacterium]HOL25919.1 substrate-binding domain-containing protein [Phycisphaerae bacterium]HPP21149.1 substrate-binding domain-containing protein [Phycisphaerae bacterium]